MPPPPASRPDEEPVIVVADLDRRWWATPLAVLLLAAAVAWAPVNDDRPGDRVTAGSVDGGRGGIVAGGVEAEAAEVALGEQMADVEGAVEGVVRSGGGSSGASGPSGVGAAPASAGGGDRSHCTADGRQHAAVFHAPRCVARWSGVNGGATSPGVTERAINVYVLHEQYDAALNAAYEAAGYEIASRDDIIAFDQAAAAHLNRRVELYGRRIEVTSFFTACGYPEDIPRCRQSIREVIEAKPFAVVFSIGSYSQIFDDFARAGILTVGAHWFDDQVYARNAPYLVSGRLSATRAFDHVAEYGCAKLAGRPADRSGTTIHRTIGARGSVPRRFGLMVPEDPAALAAARSLQKALAACDGGRAPVIATYTNDVATAAVQVNAIALRFIGEGVTTVVPWNTSSASFLTAEATRQRWYPEWIVTGIGRMDEDDNGQRMDPSQWQHAFGPAMSAEPVPFAEGVAAQIWRDAGREGLPHEDTDRGPGDFLVLGWALQGAGPQLTPERAAAALAAGGRRGGTAADGRLQPMWSFSDADRTAVDDAREVFFDVTAVSPANGEAGTYRSVTPGRRVAPGGWSGGLAVPVAPS